MRNAGGAQKDSCCELENLMERACILEKTNVLTPEGLPSGLFETADAQAEIPIEATFRWPKPAGAPLMTLNASISKRC